MKLGMNLIIEILKKHLEVDKIDGMEIYVELFDDEPTSSNGYVCGVWYKEKFYGVKFDRDMRIFGLDEIEL